MTYCPAAIETTPPGIVKAEYICGCTDTHHHNATPYTGTKTTFMCWYCGQQDASYIDYLNHKKVCMSPDKTPDHYQGDGMQPFDVIEAFGLDFWAGNVIKYLCRAGKKGPALDDLKKARHYLDYMIAKEEG